MSVLAEVVQGGCNTYGTEAGAVCVPGTSLYPAVDQMLASAISVWGTALSRRR